MKRIKLFPAPHVELRVHVSDQMVEDYKKCEEDDDFDCSQCSWNDVKIVNKSICGLKEMEQLLEE